MKHRFTFKKAPILVLAALGWFIAGSASVLAQIKPDKDGIVYVKENASGSGQSWADAAGELANALKAAKTNSEIKQIWVAQGTYHPLYSPADDNFGNPAERDNAFLLVNGVSVYGGFKGDETDPSQRNLNNPQFASILDGNFRGTVSYHVVVAVGATNNNTFLDGFTVKNGNADGSSNLTIGGVAVDRNAGGGIALFNNPVIILRNIIVTQNNSSNRGGGIVSVQNDVVNISTIQVTENTSAYFGGGIVHQGGTHSRMTVVNSRISGNSLTQPNTQNGGGIYNLSYLSLRNVEISGNKAISGSGIYSYEINSSSIAELKLLNCTISGNLATGSGENNSAVYTRSSVETPIRNTVIQGNSGGVRASGTTQVIYRNSLVQGATTNDAHNNIDGNSHPFFLGAPHHSTAPFTGGHYAVVPTSPLINAGNGAHYTGDGANLGLDKDLAGKARVYNYGSGGTIDIGAFEYHPVTPVPHASGILYVKKFSTGNGSSWANALGEVADALKAAKTNFNIKQIWVAGGIYLPFYNPDDVQFGDVAPGRNAAFVLVAGVKVYGGFAGTESSLNQRNLSNTANRSTLSGDLLGNDDSLDDQPRSENVFHVVIRAGVSALETLLDGFTISGGISDWEETHPGVTVNGVDVRPNAGGGAILRSTNLSPVNFANLQIHSNYAKKGGGIHIFNSSLSLEQSEISFNHAAEQGGGLFKSGALGESGLTQVRIHHCEASQGGGIYAAGPLKLRFSNGQVDQNEAFTGAGAVSTNRMEFIIRKSIFQSNTASGAGGAIHNHDRAVLDAKYVVFSGNRVTSSTGYGAGISNLQNTTARLVNVLFSGNTSYRGSAVWGDLTSGTTLVNVTVSGNRSTATETGAVMVQGGSVLKVHNSIVWKNSGGVSQAGSNTIEYKHSLVQGITTNDAEGNISGSTNPGFIDAPEFNTAPFTGGDYKLSGTSPVLDKGSNTLYTDAGGNLENDTDLDGNARIFMPLLGGIIDLGPYEIPNKSDLYPSVTMLNRSYTSASLSKSLTLRLNNNIEGVALGSPISVVVTKPNNQFTLTLGAVEFWEIDTFSTYWLLTYNGSLPLPQNLPATLSIPDNNTKGKFNLLFTIPNNTWGDFNNANNRINVPLTVN